MLGFIKDAHKFWKLNKLCIGINYVLLPFTEREGLWEACRRGVLPDHFYVGAAADTSEYDVHQFDGKGILNAEDDLVSLRCTLGPVMASEMVRNKISS